MLKIRRKSLLYKSGVEYADYCINHIEGCSHGCKFPCYAMMMKKRFGKIKDYNDWIKPKIVVNALDILDTELPKLKDKIKVVHLSFMTDPFMYQQKEVADLTLKIIERLNKDNIRCTVLTKGIYPKQLANVEKYGKNNEYSITLVSLDRGFKNKFEPGAAPYDERIRALKYLHDKGLKTWVSMEPYPTPNLVKQDLITLQEVRKMSLQEQYEWLKEEKSWLEPCLLDHQVRLLKLQNLSRKELLHQGTAWKHWQVQKYSEQLTQLRTLS